MKANGQLESQGNLAKGLGFKGGCDPEKRKFSMKYGTSNISLYPLLKSLGVPDEALEKSWGKAIFDKNKAVKEKQELQKFYKAAVVE